MDRTGAYALLILCLLSQVATLGGPGEEIALELTLRVVADVGLVVWVSAFLLFFEQWRIGSRLYADFGRTTGIPERRKIIIVGSSDGCKA